MYRLLEVDLSETSSRVRELPEGLLRRALGGSGLGTQLLNDELPAGADPLGRESVLLFLTGPFAATPVPCGERTSVICKSPLTGGWGGSDLGGRFGGVLRSCGFEGILLHGRSEHPRVLRMREGRVALGSTDYLWGQDTYATHEMLAADEGAEASTLAVGPAGERQVLLSGIVSDGKDARVAARCGVGAVMGAKGLKAVCVMRGDHRVPLHDPERLQEMIRGSSRRGRSRRPGAGAPSAHGALSLRLLPHRLRADRSGSGRSLGHSARSGRPGIRDHGLSGGKPADRRSGSSSQSQ